MEIKDGHEQRKQILQRKKYHGSEPNTLLYYQRIDKIVLRLPYFDANPHVIGYGK